MLFEYWIREIEPSIVLIPPSLQKILDDYGNSGWELITVVGNRFYFKRIVGE